MFEQLKKQEEHKLKKEHLPYVPPASITYNGDDLIEELGPAQTCASDHGCPVSDSPGLSFSRGIHSDRYTLKGLVCFK